MMRWKITTIDVDDSDIASWDIGLRLPTNMY